jgi:hypothetical protein
VTFAPLLLLGICTVILVLFSIQEKSSSSQRTLRKVKAFDELTRTIELSVEDGTRLQVSLGSGGLLGPQSAAAFAGLALLRQVAETIADGDEPPLVTTGDGTLMLLAQDTLRGTYHRLNIPRVYEAQSARATGLTPFSFAAGALPLTLDRSILASALTGSFGNEAALLTGASLKEEAFTVGGSDNLSTQAIFFATANEPLLGEEIYATGAYLNAGPMHQASLYLQDVLRWIIILLMTASALTSILGGVQ